MTNTKADPARREGASFFVFSGFVFAVSVVATIYFCRSMSGGMNMPGGWTMSMLWMRMPGQTWAASAAMFLLMWLAMMVAMMLPSALPMLLNFRQSLIGHGNENFGTPMMLVAAGYFNVWLMFGAVVYVLGALFALAAMHSEWLSRLVPVLSGAALIAAGAIQFTDWKISSLRRCRAPGCADLQSCHVSKAGWRYGLKQGVACFNCCLAPMLALLVLGPMNSTVMVLIAAIIATEKLIPKPERCVRIFGIVVAAIGIAVTGRVLLAAE